jgi:hypothetical protein
MFGLLADVVIQQGGAGAAWSVGQIAIAIVIVAAIVGAVYVGLQQFGVAIPPFIVKLFWIVVAAIAVVLVIKFLMTL